MLTTRLAVEIAKLIKSYLLIDTTSPLRGKPNIDSLTAQFISEYFQAVKAVFFGGACEKYLELTEKN